MKRSFAIAAAFALVLPASAIWMRMDENVPISRLLANVKTSLRKNFKDPWLHYLKARLHSLAFAQEKDFAAVHENKDNPHDKSPFQFPAIQTLQVLRTPGKLRRGELEHLRQSLLEYRKAADLDPNRGIHLLGLAWMHESGAPFAKQLKSLPWRKKGLTTAWMDKRAEELYWKIYRNWKARDFDAQESLMGMQDVYVSQEAAERLIAIGRLTKSQREALQADIAKLEAKYTGVTPIIFPVSGSARFSALINKQARVKFDLLGDGKKRTWQWPNAGAAFLVWDPQRTGEITSGRQLFGTGTFWMMFRDGYRALDSLDNNKDGWLRGRELQGVSVWHDRNTNGVSEQGEVRTIAAVGIVGVRTKAAGRSEGMLCAPKGIMLRGGATLPSYDWVTNPVR